MFKFGGVVFVVIMAMKCDRKSQLKFKKFWLTMSLEYITLWTIVAFFDKICKPVEDKFNLFQFMAYSFCSLNNMSSR